MSNGPAVFTLRSATLSLTVQNPDPQHSPYRGARFDWSSQIGNLRHDGRTWFGPWIDNSDGKLDPHSNDACIVGIGGEFGRGDMQMPGPLGYDSAKAGDTFLKLGVGEILRPDDTPYCFWNDYRVAKPLPWAIASTADSITLTQSASLRGHGYRFQRQLKLIDALPGFIIDCSLSNTGSLPLHQHYYDHNFTNVDGRLPGPAWRLELPWLPKPTVDMGARGQINGKQLRILTPIAKNSALFTELNGFGDTASDNQYTIWNDDIGQGMQVSGTKPINRFAFFAAHQAVCPEPFIDLKLAPGQSTQWSSTYMLRSAK